MQVEKRVVRITVAGPPSQPARVIEVDDPQVCAYATAYSSMLVLCCCMQVHL
jgi:hypothetical protein